MTGKDAAELLARKVREKGGRAYFVGGYVRDLVMGAESADLDIEVYGIKRDTLLEILRGIGQVTGEGSAYGIFTLGEYGMDVAMPRTEKCTGRGHRDFETEPDPGLDIRTAARRRDFTVNAMLCDVLTGEIEDPFNGRADIGKGILRHVDPEAFADDPLRLLRACRFSSRLGFEIAPETLELCRGMDISSLAKERVEAEMKNALLLSERPSVFFEALRAMGKLSCWFPELEALTGLEQDRENHPEGDVWKHTMECLDRAAGLRERSREPYSFMLFALTHDLGKLRTTELINGRIHAYGHEENITDAMNLIERISTGRAIKKYLANMIPLHMKPNIIAGSRAALKSSNRMFDNACEPYDLILFSRVDKVYPDSAERERFLSERLGEYRRIMAEPYVTAGELMDKGVKSGEALGKLLEYAHKLRLAGVDRNSALRQTLAEARRIDAKAGGK